MNKRIRKLIVLAAVFLLLIPHALAAEPESGTCGSNVRWSLDQNGVLTVSGEGAMDLYSRPQNAPWYDRDDMEKIRQVIIEEGVTVVGNNAFAGQTALTRAVIPSTVTFISNSAFAECTALTDVTIAPGEKALSIGKSVFSGCSALKAITVPSNTSFIDNYAFAHCSALETVTLEEGVSSFGEGVFHSCTALKEITLPGSLYNVGPITFHSCANLENVTMKEGIGRIDNAAFIECRALKTVIIPRSVWFLGEDAFYLCEGLEELVIRNPNIQVENIGAILATWNAFGHPIVNTVHISPFSPLVSRIEDIGFKLAPHTPGADGKCTACQSYCEMFPDVLEGTYCYDPIVWALNRNITNGMSATSFAPNAPCTRGQVVTFLWRAAGCPEPTQTAHPFTDLSEKAFYYKSVLWAVERGITNGVTATTFGPDAPCTRGQVVTFLWRSHYKPTSSGYVGFTDVSPDAFYYDAMKWAVANRITTGITATTFGPGETCTRGQIVTFLQRESFVAKG